VEQLEDAPPPDLEEHSGCSQKSQEEGEAVRQYFELLLAQHFQDRSGRVRRLTVDDILVVSPYNVQVNHLTAILPAGARVVAVDKFQGQEAPAVIVAMATSAAEGMPRNIEFLFTPNRLNVALSWAQCLALVVASPRLLETPCRSIEQMRLVHKFCQLAAYPTWLPRSSTRPDAKEKNPRTRGVFSACRGKKCKMSPNSAGLPLQCFLAFATLGLDPHRGDSE
jgi:hypothetical protein